MWPGLHVGKESPFTVGVLSVQGDFAEHIESLKAIGVSARQVKLANELENVQALIIPGGESTTLRRMVDHNNLAPVITDIASRGIPVWGTCAGMILMANNLVDKRPNTLGLMDITVARNGFGRQINSFEVNLEVPALGSEPFPGIFIRAPLVVSTGDQAKVLTKLIDGTPVAIQQENLLATSFHPELTSDTRFHQFFVRLSNAYN